MSDFEKFKEELLSKEKFISSLTDRKITDKEYEHVLSVWNKFEIKTMKDDHDLYLKRDALILLGVFEKFRNNSLKNYGLCRSQLLSAPCLSWDAQIKMKKNVLEIIQILACIHSMRKIQEKEFLIFLIDTGKPTINI